MKSYLALIILILTSYFCGFSQESNLSKPKLEKNTGKDIIILDLYSDLWQNVPTNVDVRAINQGVNIYAMFNLPFARSNFSLSSGLGVSSHNFYSDAVPITGVSGTSFIKLGDFYQKKVDYSINKINITYIDIPVEIKFKTRAERSKRFKASIGCKIGYNISNHTKYRGEDVIENTSDYITLKKSNIKNLSDWNYGVTARIGYGMYNLMAYYSISKLFENNKGPQIYPISIGISITPF